MFVAPWLADVGEGLRAQYEAEAEEHRQRSIRSTEEVVTREETGKREEALKQAREEWDRERQQLFVEAHQNQLRAIAKHTAILEEKLRSEFASKMKQTVAEGEKRLREAVERTWLEARAVQDKAVQQARSEERERARLEAERVRGVVAEEKAAEQEQAQLDKDRALDSQRARLEEEKERALQEQRQELGADMQLKLVAQQEDCDLRHAALQAKYKQQMTVTEEVRQDLMNMTELKAEWEERHARLRKEFADFIDKVPGFRAEYILQ